MNAQEELSPSGAVSETLPKLSAGASRPGWQIVLGFALITPAAIFLVISYVEPTLWAIETSLEPLELPRGWTGISAGSSTFSAVIAKGFYSTVGYSLSSLKLPLVAIGLVAPVLTLLLRGLARGSRALVLAGLVPAAVAFTPVAISACARVARSDSLVGADGEAAEGIGTTVANMWGCASFALLTFIAVMVYQAATRARQMSSCVVAGLVMVAVVIAVGLQEFVFPFVLTGGGPNGETTTPVLFMFSVGFQQVSFGPAAASCLLLLGILAVLGVGVTLLLIGTRARLDLDGHRADCAEHDLARASDQLRREHDAPGARRWSDRRWLGRTASAVLGVAVVAAVVVVTAIAIYPWIQALIADEDPPLGSVSQTATFVNTWVPPMVSTVVGVGAAAVGGYGVGAARPLGPRSEWLLLPFAPFLFVGTGPLALRAYAEGATADRLQTIFGLVPPSRLAIPALFVFTMLARGQAVADQIARRDGVSRSWSQTYLMPTLPMIGVLASVMWVAQAQDLLWPVLSGSGDWATGPVRLYDLLGGGGLTGELPVSLALPWWILATAVVLTILAQVAYLDRLTLRTGDRGECGA